MFELLGKYRDYYKSVDRDIRVIIESAQPASISVDGGGVGVVPDGVEINGKLGRQYRDWETYLKGLLCIKHRIPKRILRTHQPLRTHPTQGRSYTELMDPSSR